MMRSAIDGTALGLALRFRVGGSFIRPITAAAVSCKVMAVLIFIGVFVDLCFRYKVSNGLL